MNTRSETQITLNRRQYLELEKIALGAFAPLTGFMKEEEFHSVVEAMRLPDGQPFPLPVVLDLKKEQAPLARKGDSLKLVFDGVEVGQVVPESVFFCDKKRVSERIFGTPDPRHPGVAHFLAMGDCFVGGAVRLERRVRFEFSDYEFTPSETRAYFARKGWKTVVGFQTRNVPHKSHEYLLRLALEMADGLFIQPLVGRKKYGDYTAEAILTGYRALIEGFLPRQRVHLAILSTAMRYAGPREAVFHAIVRRNYGCTHFIVGRDHAGVDNYYGKYEAHELTRRFEGELGIQILTFCGPFHCSICGGIVTERTCPHAEENPQAIRQVNGTDIRSMLTNGGSCTPELIRPEILESVRHVPLFIEKEEM
jgi:sulfate adenylyltransferase